MNGFIGATTRARKGIDPLEELALKPVQQLDYELVTLVRHRLRVRLRSLLQGRHGNLRARKLLIGNDEHDGRSKE